MAYLAMRVHVPSGGVERDTAESPDPESVVEQKASRMSPEAAEAIAGTVLTVLNTVGLLDPAT